MVETTSVESVFSNTLRSTQEVSTLPTSRTPTETPSPPESATFSLLEKAKNPSSHFSQEKESSSLLWKKDRSNIQEKKQHECYKMVEHAIEVTMLLVFVD